MTGERLRECWVTGAARSVLWHSRPLEVGLRWWVGVSPGTKYTDTELAALADFLRRITVAGHSATTELAGS